MNNHYWIYTRVDYENTYRHRDDSDDTTCRIKVEALTFDDVHDPRVLCNWLADVITLTGIDIRRA